MKKISNKFHQGAKLLITVLLVIFVGIVFNPCPFLPSVATDSRKLFQCQNIVLTLNSLEKDILSRFFSNLTQLIAIYRKLKTCNIYIQI